MGNSLTFGPVNSSDFDVVISGEGVLMPLKRTSRKWPSRAGTEI